MTKYLLIGLGIALGLSLLGNAALTHRYLATRDELTRTKGERDEARADASACSDATDDLRRLADQRAKESAPVVAAAGAAAVQREQRAQQILSTPASIPTDDCKSAVVQMDGWLSSRGAK